MSCKGNDFSNLKNSWSEKSDLTPSSLEENYGCCDGTYSQLKSIHNQKQHVLSNSVRLENYKSPYTNPTNYDLLDQTWSPQKQYSLENYKSPYTNPTNYDLLDQTWSPQKQYSL